MTPFTEEDAELILSSGLFDPTHYAKNYMGCAASPMEAALDYLRYATFDRRSPSPGFDGLKYALDHRATIEPNTPPLLHFLRHGRKKELRAFTVWAPHRANLATGDLSLAELKPRLALHAHLYYLDALPDLAARLSAFPGQLDLFVSLPEGASPDPVRKLLEPHLKGKLTIEAVPNRGRNFAPLLVTFAAALREYDFIGHIHTKKSLYSGKEQFLWRDHLWSAVLGSPGVMNKVFGAFSTHPNLLLVSSDRYPALPYWSRHWLQNKAIGDRLAKRLGLRFPLRSFVDYPAGGMFWARRSLMDKFFDLQLSYEDFPAEAGQTDGATHHAVERLIGEVATQHGCYATYSPQRGGIAIERDVWLREYASVSRQSVHDDIDKYDVISFDLFDTLVVRDAASTETAKRIVAEANRSTLGLDYEACRNKAEFEARRAKNWAGDVNMLDIAIYLSQLAEISIDRSLSLLGQEADADLRLLEPRHPVISLYDFARSREKRVVITSDTYYSEGTIRAILQKCGINEPDALYLSSEIGARKDRGDIWKVVKHKEAGRRILHIGDNAVSDVQRASDAAITARFILSAIEKARAHGALRREPTEEEWPLVRDVVHALGNDPFFS